MSQAVASQVIAGQIIVGWAIGDATLIRGKVALEKERTIDWLGKNLLTK